MPVFRNGAKDPTDIVIMPDMIQISTRPILLPERQNSGISTPSGNLVVNERVMRTFIQSNERWLLTGVTRDKDGNPLGGCRVVILETGRIVVGEAPVVQETISDGSGNYSIEVIGNTAYQATAYLPGAPDRAGITRNVIVPIANG